MDSQDTSATVETNVFHGTTCVTENTTVQTEQMSVDAVRLSSLALLPHSC